jgi:hypothetical protein
MGELKELKRESVQQRIAERDRAKRQRQAARTLTELLALAKQRGYSPGWAYRIHQARGQR